MNALEPRRTRGRLPFLAALVLALVLAPGAGAQQTGTLTGRVIDDATQQPIVDVLVWIRDTQISTLTAADGRFTLRNVPLGPQVVLLQHLGYGDHIRAVNVGSEAEVRLQVRLAARALQLDSVVVEAASELEQRRVSTGFAMNEIQRPTIDRASQMGISLGQLLQNEMPGVRVRGGANGPNTCVEYRGSVNVDGACRELGVFLDGVPVTSPSALYAMMPVNEIERLEVLSPGQAGALYGASGGWGVLLIETRRGTRPENPTLRTDQMIFGFDWSMEQDGYPWLRVAGSSLLGNALGLGLSYYAAEQCFEVRTRGILSVQTARCNAVTTMLAGFVTLALPSAMGSYAARWAGGTERSRGRVLPGLIVGTITSAGGYLMLVRGQGTDSPASTIAGAALLSIGTPLLLTISDRALRVLR